MKTGSNPQDINRFRSDNRKKIFCLFITICHAKLGHLGQWVGTGSLSGFCIAGRSNAGLGHHTGYKKKNTTFKNIGFQCFIRIFKGKAPIIHLKSPRNPYNKEN